MTSTCKAFITTKNSNKTRRCKRHATLNGLCSSHKTKNLLTRTKTELDAADALVTLSQIHQCNVSTESTSQLTNQSIETVDYTGFTNYKDTINSMEREYNNSIEFLNIEFQKLKSHLTLNELDKMDVLCKGIFEKYEEYNNNLKTDIDTQLDYYENIIEKLYEDRKILVSNMKYREEQMEEMKTLVTDARERLTYLHDLLTL